MDTAGALVERLRAAGRKVTPQRLLLLELLEGNPVHPTAEALHEQALERMPTLALKTVYSVLHDLADLGEVKLLELGTGATRVDPNVGAHHHLVCTACGRVVDVHPRLDGVTLDASEQHGFAIEQTEVVFRGRCPACVAVPSA